MIGQTNEKIQSKKFHRKLRSNMTDAEQALWRVLRGRQFSGCKFCRQHPFGDYILDFACLSNKLVIEVDGGQHCSLTEYDEIRTRKLQSAGFYLLRFWNNEVFEEFEAVKEKIRMAVQERQESVDQPHPHPNLPPEGEGTRAKCVEGLCQLTVTLILFTVILFTTAPAFAEIADPHPKLSLSLSPGKTETYPGEAVPVMVTLRINDATLRNIGYPRLDAPDGKIISFAPPVQESDAADTGIILQRFSGQIRSVRPGKLIVGPARLDCEVMKSATGSAAFFGGQESEPVQLTSNTAAVAVLPLPASGKPEHFSGAIGTFSLTVKSLPAQVAPGEPLTVTTTIRGAGSLDDASCPTIAGSELQSFPVRATRSASQLGCEQVVVPGGVAQLPPVIWNYFDPQKRQYHVLSAAIGSRVMARSPDSQAAASSPAMVKPASSQTLPALSGRLLTILFAVSAVGFLVVVAVRKRNKPVLEAMPQDVWSDLPKMLLAVEEAAMHGDAEFFYNRVFEVVSVVKNRNSMPLAPVVLDHHKKRWFSCVKNFKTDGGVTSEELNALVTSCDKVRYGRINGDSAAIAADLELLRNILTQTTAKNRGGSSS
ncbi:MAG: endonuclease domain-containing protein [Desulfuromonadaceae bacterium]